MTRMKARLAVLATVSALLALAGCSGGNGGAPAANGTTAAANGQGQVGDGPTTPAAPTPKLSGTLFYLGIGTHGGLYTLKGTTVATAVPDNSFGFYQSAVVSQDGTKVAYALGDQAGSTGQMRVITLGGATTTIGPNTIQNLLAPQWTADGSGIYVAYGASGFGLLNVASGAITPVTSATGCCFGIRSPDGAYAIVRNGTTNNITKGDGSSPVPGVTPAGQLWGRMQSLSPDGKHMVGLLRPTGTPGGDAGRTLAANTIIDFTTGTIVAVPGGGTLVQAWYLADGKLVVRATVGSTKVVRLVAADFTVLDEKTEPADTADLVLLGYAP